ncbi:MAG: serine hydrolase domain-containing protein [Ilumatobacteraceae bacterium]
MPGAVALVASGDEVEVACAGARAIDGEPMSRDTLFRIASITKPIVAAATMVLVERGRLTLDESVERLLPELADPVVLRASTARSTTSSPPHVRSPCAICSPSRRATGSHRTSQRPSSPC